VFTTGQCIRVLRLVRGCGPRPVTPGYWPDQLTTKGRVSRRGLAVKRLPSAEAYSHLRGGSTLTRGVCRYPLISPTVARYGFVSVGTRQGIGVARHSTRAEFGFPTNNKDVFIVGRHSTVDYARGDTTPVLLAASPCYCRSSVPPDFGLFRIATLGPRPAILTRLVGHRHSGQRHVSGLTRSSFSWRFGNGLAKQRPDQ